jgi:5-oxoprolinase (ATP-hydrolysing) subunit A
VSADVVRFGDAALRLHIAPGADTRVLLEALRRVPGVLDATVTEEHALVVFEPAAEPSATSLADVVRLARSASRGTEAAATHVVRVRYAGPDLDHVARLAGMTTPEVVRAHAGPIYEVAFLGFMPGFAYLRGLDPRLSVPRRDTPRPRVPALSLGVAGPYTGIYPFASPGGWNLIGEVVGFVPFDARSGARLQLGDRVRFTPEDP